MTKTFSSYVSSIISFSNSAIIVLIGVALVVFLWGGVRYIYRTQETGRSNPADKTALLWGLISLFVLVSLAGIISVMQQSLLP